MDTARNHQDLAESFGAIARRYCAIVDTAPTLDKDQLLLQIYRILPDLISAVIHFPDTDPWDRNGKGSTDIENSEKDPPPQVTQEECRVLRDILTRKLGDNDRHWDVFNPASGDHEVVYGSLADDIADIYRDLKEPLALMDKRKITAEMALWDWSLGFTTHWGHHAIGALKAIHCMLHY